MVDYFQPFEDDFTSQSYKSDPETTKLPPKEITFHEGDSPLNSGSLDESAFQRPAIIKFKRNAA
jgi:hypothetical protein